MVKAVLTGLSIWIALTVSGCALQQPVTEHALPKEDEVIKQQLKVKYKVAILLSSDAEAYSSVAEILLASKKHDFSLFVLDGIKNNSIVNDLNSGDYDCFVTLGLPATISMTESASNKVIFSQIFNYYEYDLNKPGVMGVSVFPSAKDLMSTWQKLSPDLNSVVVITGEGLDSYINSAQKMAKSHGIELVHMLASNDKEFLYFIKNKTSLAQGYWLLPDNRILSGRVLKEFLSFSSKRSRQVAVFSAELLNYGGLISIAPSRKGIANSILENIDGLVKNELVAGFMANVADSDIYINSIVADQLGLVIDKSIRQFVYE
ncbi:MAG: hypothetical protein OEZ38_02495 [Gammaproteobacteria bacterium]|nr:hypothetical protein [Gammaproteobacteria bacterium]